MLGKYKFSTVHWMFSIKYFFVSLIYLFFNALGLEHILVQKRNKVKLEKKKYTFYI